MALYSQDHLGNIQPSAFRMPQITPVSRWLSGDATFAALKDAVEELTSAAPEDHDVIIQAFDIDVVEVSYVEPHTFLCRGFNQEGDHTSVVAHFSQLVARVIYRPKRGPERVITGFARDTQEEKEPG